MSEYKVKAIKSSESTITNHSLNILGRTFTQRKVRAQSYLFRYKLKIYCALHKPVGRAKYYHLFVIILILLSGIVLNVFEESFGEESMKLMIILDSILIIVLVLESILRFWSSDCIHEYEGFKGKLSYYRNKAFMRGLDFIGIFTFTAFVIYQDFNGFLGISLRIFHFIQVFQLYRVIYSYLKIFITTIYDQFNQLYIALVFSGVTMVLISFGVHTLEHRVNNDINDIFDGFWFGFITLSTIGYGDKYPQTGAGRGLTCVLAVFGICMLTLPANIFGTGLAIKLKEQQQTVLQKSPASKLIQSIWKCYASDKRSKSIAIWNLNKADGEPLNELDKECIRFLRLLNYKTARIEFKLAMNPRKIEDDSGMQLDLLRRIEYMEKTVSDIKYRVYEIASDLRDINASLSDLFSKYEQRINDLVNENKV